MSIPLTMKTLSKSASGRRLFYGVYIAALACVTLEIACRFFVPAYKKYHPIPNLDASQQHLFFQHDDLLGWAPRPDVNETVLSSNQRELRVYHNREGFRDIEHHLQTDPRPKWCFLGDSFVWGFNVNAAERFTDKIAAQREDAAIFNCGVSGYGTEQSLLMYLYRVRFYRPEKVILVYGGNDRADNIKAITRGGYAKPCIQIRGGSIHLENFRVPNLDPLNKRIPWYRSHLLDHLGYRKNRLLKRMAKDPTLETIRMFFDIVKKDHAAFLLVVKDDDPSVTQFCQSIGCPVIEMHDYFEVGPNPESTQYYPREQGGHWTPWAHSVVAETIMAHFQKESSSEVNALRRRMASRAHSYPPLAHGAAAGADL